MEGYRAHNSNTHYALCLIPFTGYGCVQSVCQLYAFYVLQTDRGDNSIWVFCIPNYALTQRASP